MQHELALLAEGLRAEAWRVSDAALTRTQNDETLESAAKHGMRVARRAARRRAHARASKSDCTSSSRLGVKALLRYTNCDHITRKRVR